MIRSRWWWPSDRYVAEDAVDLVDVDYDPLPPVVDYVAGHGHEPLVHDAYPGNVAGSLGQPPSERLTGVFESAAHDIGVTIYQQAYAPVPMETRGMVAEWSGDELTVWAATQAPHEVRMFLARLLGIGEHQVRVIMRDTGGGFGQKVAPMREDMCIALAADASARRAEVDRGPPGEPARRRDVPPRARRRPHGVRRPGPDRRRLHRPRAGRRRLPDAVAGGHGGRRRDAVPRAVPGAAGRVPHDVGLLQHLRSGRLPRPVAVRVAGP